MSDDVLLKESQANAFIGCVHLSQPNVIVQVRGFIAKAVAEDVEAVRDIIWFAGAIHSIRNGVLSLVSWAELLYILKQFMGFIGSSGSVVEPPTNLCRALMNSNPGFLPVDAIYRFPVVDGNRLLPQGYDARTGSLSIWPSWAILDGDRLSDMAVGDGRFSSVEGWKGMDSFARFCFVCDDVLVDFRFAEPRDIVVTLTTILANLACRHVTKPALIINSGTPRIGKGMLADVIIGLSYGVESQKYPGLIRSQDEEAKFLFASALAQKSFVAFDNVEAPVGTDGMQSILTSRRLTGRRLGVSHIDEVTWTPQFIFIGNNVAIRSDMTNRIVQINLDTNDPNPAARSGFKHVNVVSEAIRLHPLAAIYGINAILDFANNPGSVRLHHGSFDVWSFSARSLIASKFDSDALSPSEVFKIDNVVEDFNEAFMTALNDKYGKCAPIEVTSLLDIALSYAHSRQSKFSSFAMSSEDEALGRALYEACYGRPTSKYVGRCLSRVSNRNILGLRLKKVRSAAKRYYVLLDVSKDVVL